MIEGEVAGWEPLIALTVLGPAGDVSLSAVVDTGFTGDLTSPAETTESLALNFLAVETITLADDASRQSRIFDADVLWDGEQRRVTVLETGSVPLIGMGLLDGFRLTVEASGGVGLVEIERSAPLFAQDT